ncbi:MAG: hypothetical protein QOK20_3292, partial [Acidimicrobiaceae bacterium]|nr:hypothetical protein [Acidimicrobiaceae bacterium]
SAKYVANVDFDATTAGHPVISGIPAPIWFL